MAMKAVYVILLALLLASCSPSPAQITATAIIAETETQSAVPTLTPTVTFTPTSTFTPEPPTLTPTPTLGIGSTEISPKDGMILLYVPAGNFLMGSTNSDANALPDEKPQHTVYLDAFWIDQTDVTNAMYAKCVRASACNKPEAINSFNSSNYYGNSKFDNYSVTWVTRDDATTYCKWAGRQLPTEAQWEKAARGTDGRIYPWGNNAPDNTLLNYNWLGVGTTAVGSYPKGASPYGALDMEGNVWQWVADWYSDTYYQSSPSSNPLGPDLGKDYMVRGGFLYDYLSVKVDAVRSAVRTESTGLNGDPGASSDLTGFRCVRSQ